MNTDRRPLPNEGPPRSPVASCRVWGPVAPRGESRSSDDEHRGGDVMHDRMRDAPKEKPIHSFTPM